MLHGAPGAAPHTLPHTLPRPEPYQKVNIVASTQSSSATDLENEITRETANLIKVYGEKREALVSILAGQLAVLKQEAQVILGLCGLVITVTGFSGGNVIKAGSVSSAFLVTGIVFVMSAVSLAMYALGHIRWVTQVRKQGRTQMFSQFWEAHLLEDRDCMFPVVLLHTPTA